MYSLVNDYSEVAHQDILAAVASTATLQNPGYGLDVHCREAADLIKAHIEQPDADVHYLVGGTQTNLTAICVMLKPWQAAISAHLGHINVHEGGAVEATGHKVIAMVCPDGKLTPTDVRQALHDHPDEHSVEPKVVYISNPTEVGTQYVKAELEALYQVCQTEGLYLYLDGARLGTALTSPRNDVTMADIARLTDMFYIGGTQAGALFGEALIITNADLQKGFRRGIKRHGGLLAKGWLLGVQFKALFTNNLFYTLGAHANAMSAILRKGLEECGFPLVADSVTNQLFVVFPRVLLERVEKSFSVARQRTCVETDEVMF